MVWTDFIAPVLAAFSAFISAWLAFRGSKGANRTDSLAKAANLYGSYAEKMEQRVEKLENDQVVLEERITASEAQAEIYREESRGYRAILKDVAEWISEIVDWEMRDRRAPRPKHSLKTVLAHITNSMNLHDSSNREDI